MQEIQETWVQFLGQEDPWGRKWQPNLWYSCLEIPWTEEPGGLLSLGSQSQTWLSLHTYTKMPTKLLKETGDRGQADP